VSPQSSDSTAVQLYVQLCVFSDMRETLLPALPLDGVTAVASTIKDSWPLASGLPLLLCSL
jgi:hypothetical protein